MNKLMIKLIKKLINKLNIILKFKSKFYLFKKIKNIYYS